jgi:hypothetical protein
MILDSGKPASTNFRFANSEVAMNCATVLSHVRKVWWTAIISETAEVSSALPR